MTNRVIPFVAAVALLVVALGAAQVVAGRPGDEDANAEQFPVAAPYREPTPTVVTPTATVPELPAADVPGEDVPDIPRYPESVRTSYEGATSASMTMVEIQYMTLDPLDAVHEHVRNIVTTFGWSLEREEFSGQERSFSMRRDHSEAEIRLYLEQGRTVMSLTYTEHAVSEPEPTSEPVTQEEPVVQPEPTIEQQPEPEPEPQTNQVSEPEPAPPVAPAESDGGEEQVEQPEASNDNEGESQESESETQENKPEKNENSQKPEKQDNPGNSGGENGPPEDAGPPANPGNGGGNGPPDDKGPDHNNGNKKEKKNKKD